MRFNIIDLEDATLNTKRSFSLDVLDGLSSEPKSLPCKYLYDERGSLLFEKITELQEYYPTMCELDILHRRKNDISRIVSSTPFRLIELGVGDARKTRILLNHFLQHGLTFEYVLIDCCGEVIHQVVNALKHEYDSLPIHIIGLIADYSSALNWLHEEPSKKNIVLFLGSSIGNFDKKQTPHFLNEIWNSLNHNDYLFIGFDLKKDIKILELAYNDPLGVTKDFNLNLLSRINRELGANFDPSKFVHHCFYEPFEGRMESWLVSIEKQKVCIEELKKTFDFAAWEGIHIENSYKYSIEDIEILASKTGYHTLESLYDAKGYFLDAIWQVNKYIGSSHEKTTGHPTSALSSDKAS